MKRKVKYLLCLILVGGTGLLLWDLLVYPESLHVPSAISFDHEKHGENIGVDCAKCHGGAETGMRALMPAKSDCMDCHNLPLTGTAEDEKLQEALKNASDFPFRFTSLLPANVIFPHGLHTKAGVTCETCHGCAKEINAGTRAIVRMADCMDCHRGNRGFPKASTDCARCHR